MDHDLARAIDSLADAIRRLDDTLGKGATTSAERPDGAQPALVDKLSELRTLADRDLISEDEYSERKDEMIRRWAAP